MSNYKPLKSISSPVYRPIGALAGSTMLFLSLTSSLNAAYQITLAGGQTSVVKLVSKGQVSRVTPSLQSFNATPNWMKAAQDLGMTEPTIMQVANLFTGLNDLATSQNFDKLSRTLDACDLRSLSSAMIVAIARGTYAYRERIPEWENYIESARSILASRGLDTDRVLRGIST